MAWLHKRRLRGLSTTTTAGKFMADLSKAGKANPGTVPAKECFVWDCVEDVGTYKLTGYDALHKAIDAALEAGCRSFDTASAYRNESDIGKILKILLPKYSLQRKDIFITSKLGPTEQGKGKAMSACLGSLERLDCDYLDLYLIHWPGTFKLKPEDSRHLQFRTESWKDMEEAQRQGKIRSIGVSNYLQTHIEQMYSFCSVKPAVLQIEYHPYLVQSSIKKYCEEKGILLQAYSSLGAAASEGQLLSDPTVTRIAKELNKTPAQVLLRWAFQQGIGLIPKSSNPERIKENFDIFAFTLSEQQMESLTKLDQQKHFCWDPVQIQ